MAKRHKHLHKLKSKKSIKKTLKRIKQNALIIKSLIGK